MFRSVVVSLLIVVCIGLVLTTSSHANQDTLSGRWLIIGPGFWGYMTISANRWIPSLVIAKGQITDILSRIDIDGIVLDGRNIFLMLETDDYMLGRAIDSKRVIFGLSNYVSPMGWIAFKWWPPQS